MESVEKRVWYRRLWGELQRKEEVHAAVVVSGPYLGARFMETDQGTATGDAPESFWNKVREEAGGLWKQGAVELCAAGETITVFMETLSRRPRLVILGGGHISRPLCRIGKMLDFHVTVMDDRPEFANRQQFGEADEVICGPFSQLSDRVSDVPNTYYVIVTRGHLGDAVCAEQILRRSCAYVGMIGSQAKVSMTKKKLEEAGIAARRLQELYAPIGLKIGAQTPSEIAVSILAQIIQVRHARSNSTLDPEIGAWLEREERGEAVMAQIIEKKGSAPRGAGSRMLVGKDGSSFGSVGGGLAEYEVMETARSLKETQVLEFRMDGRESASTGMICGGSIRVLLEKI